MLPTYWCRFQSSEPLVDGIRRASKAFDAHWQSQKAAEGTLGGPQRAQRGRALILSLRLPTPVNYVVNKVRRNFITCMWAAQGGFSQLPLKTAVVRGMRIKSHTDDPLMALHMSAALMMARDDNQRQICKQPRQVNHCMRRGTSKRSAPWRRRRGTSACHSATCDRSHEEVHSFNNGTHPTNFIVICWSIWHDGARLYQSLCRNSIDANSNGINFVKREEPRTMLYKCALWNTTRVPIDH